MYHLCENLVPWSALLATKGQFLDQFRSRLISQLIESISRVLQKLLRYFNGTIILTSVLPLSPVLPVTFSFILNKSVVALSALKAVIALSASKVSSSLKYCHKVQDIF